MAELDAKLQTLVDEMNKAKGSAKVDKTAAVVSELVAQRSMMQKQMMEMHPKMMDHMKEHMLSGMMKGMADSMSGCPMMKGSEKEGCGVLSGWSQVRATAWTTITVTAAKKMCAFLSPLCSFDRCPWT